MTGLASTILAIVTPAGATEGEWHLGAAFGWALRAVPGPEDTTITDHGYEGALLGRLGVSDAFDLTLTLGAAHYPEVDVVSPYAAAGVTYIVDVMRWIPHVGLDVGVADVVTQTCPDDPTLCAHDVRFVVAIPAGLELRIVPNAIVGLRFRYAFSIPAPLQNQMFLGVNGAFAM